MPNNDLTTIPDVHVFKNPEYLGTFKSTHILDEENMRKLENLLRYMTTYYKRNGIDVLTCLHDFDKANSGAVTEAQFLRGLTEPKMSTEELQLLVNKYRDPGKPGKVNYMNLHYDLLALSKLNQQPSNSYTDEDTVFTEQVRVMWRIYFSNSFFFYPSLTLQGYQIFSARNIGQNNAGHP